MKAKPNVGRGKKCGSVNSAYRIYDHREDPNGDRVGEYCFEKNTKEHELSYLKEELPNICSMLEKT